MADKDKAKDDLILIIALAQFQYHFPHMSRLL